jgi:hypothetical protein
MIISHLVIKPSPQGLSKGDYKKGYK